MQQRRWERCEGLALREGQAVGEIATQADGPRNRVTPSASLPKATDFATHQELYGRDGKSGIYALADNATDAEFDDALNTARAEGNVSRANVVRKLKEANGTAPANEPTRHHKNTC